LALGIWEDDAICIYPFHLKSFLAQQGYRYDEVVAGWRERGWIETDAGRLDKQVRRDGQRERFVALRREVVDEKAA
jgi:hypothetical protein